MTEHPAPSVPYRPVLSANAPSQAPRAAPDCNLLEGVAAQDALVALFADEFAAGEPLEIH